MIGGLLQAALGVGGFVVGLYAVLAAFGDKAILVMTLGGLGAGAVGITVGDRISRRLFVPSQSSKPVKMGPVRNRVWTDGGPRF
jgi:hypothetical protein